MIAVLIVDDSTSYRSVLRRAITQIQGTQVVGTAGSGEQALQMLKTQEVDLVTLDLVMPGMDGIATLREIKKSHPKAQVVMVSGAGSEAARMTMKALELGALDFIHKPAGNSIKGSAATLGRQIAEKVALIRKVSLRFKSAAQKSHAIPVQSAPKRCAGSGIDLVLIGVSTGGPPCLTKILPKLPGGLKAPILLVQHMPPVFTATMAEHLNEKSPLHIKEAEKEDVVAPGKVLIAPGGKHMEVCSRGSNLIIRLRDTPPVNCCRPAVDVLFRSVARYCRGKKIMVVILTGMGSDGTKGTALLKNSTSTHVIAQDEATSAVWGMPGALVKQGLADEILPQDKIACRILQLV